MPRNAPLAERLAAKIEVRGPDECWPWTGYVDPEGYGRIKNNRKQLRVHRVAWEVEHGAIPDGLVIDHVRVRGCTSRACCNTRHMEPVMNPENVARGDGVTAQNAAKTACVHGHEFTDENTVRWGPDGRWRRCRACETEREANRAWRAR